MSTMESAPDIRARPESTVIRSRIPAAFRLQFAVPGQLIWVPLIVFLASWAIGTGIGLWIQQVAGAQNGEAATMTGASQATVWTLGFLAAYVASHTFPFALALSYSRRVFMIGVSLAFAVVAAAFGVGAGLAAQLEELTDGFGAEAYTFAVPFLVDDGTIAFGLFAAALTFAVMQFGFFWASLYRRVTLILLWTLIIVIVAVLAVAAMLVTTYDGWPTVFRWVVEQHVAGLAGWLGLVGLLGVAVNYALIRRSTA
ncbi:hypothetical protein [Nesterenkonia marinintestina]|uniref:hypothetical protein n=1 Tax=Nesterenkonia marinintestina TaxID=2979865 RepID=UPI0021C1CD32|nr:hypothetical protein [Nesterenkonia sp. GX14115]